MIDIDVEELARVLGAEVAGTLTVNEHGIGEVEVFEGEERKTFIVCLEDYEVTRAMITIWRLVRVTEDLGLYD